MGKVYWGHYYGVYGVIIGTAFLEINTFDRSRLMASEKDWSAKIGASS